MRRGIESPSVTLVSAAEGKFIVMQPVKLAVVQVGPVKPFVQIQAQAPLSIIVEPPFWQAVAVEASQVSTAERVGDTDLGLLKTRNSRGTTTAAAIIRARIRRTRKKPQQGRPQQRRRCFMFLRVSGVGSPFAS